MIGLEEGTGFATSHPRSKNKLRKEPEEIYTQKWGTLP
jgi:hypothetical protein